MTDSRTYKEVSPFQKAAFQEFDVLIEIRSELNTSGLTGVSPNCQARRQKAISPLLGA